MPVDLRSALSVIAVLTSAAAAQAAGGQKAVMTSAAVGANAGVLTVDAIGDGMVAAPADTLYLNSLTQVPGSTFSLPIDAPQAAPYLAVYGTASLAGTLDLRFGSGFPPPPTPTSYDLISAGSVVGMFDTLTFTGLPAGDTAHLVYTPTDVSVQVTPVPEPSALSAVGLIVIAGVSRRRRSA